MSERTSYEPGTPCWVELSGTPDIEASERFYGAVLGWEIPEQPNSAQLGGYRRAQLGGRDVAGVSPKMQDGQPCEWNTYVSVTDADATVAKIRDAGGTVTVEPLDVMGMGKMALFTDPTGAACGVWEPGTFVGADHLFERRLPFTCPGFNDAPLLKAHADVFDEDALVRQWLGA